MQPVWIAKKLSLKFYVKIIIFGISSKALGFLITELIILINVLQIVFVFSDRKISGKINDSF